MLRTVRTLKPKAASRHVSFFPLSPTPYLLKHASISNTWKMSAENTTEGDLRLQESRLCSRCRTVNLDHEPAEMFPFPLSDADPTCHSCMALKALILKKVPSTSDKFAFVARRGYHTRDFEICSDVFSCGVSWLSIFQRGSYLDREVGCLAEYSGSSYLPEDAISPRLVDTKRADFNLIKGWMDNCLYSHSCAVLTPGGFVPNQHVINCSTRKVVPALPGCDYTALSYVWGPSQTPSYNGDTLGAVPKTVEDAIQVTQIMGFRYLWVDRYCIRQDNSRHKMEQIHSMHKIYSNAKFTIVAAAGDSPDHGLPGVSDRHRYAQPRVRLGSRLMVSTLSDPSNLICSSKWWTRGWTYQECMNSRRLLFFTEEQVYFQCKKTSFRESFHCPANNRMKPNPVFGIIQRLDIWTCINQYLIRDLTFPSDILDALFSVLRRFQDEAKKNSFRHIWGLPVQKKKNHRSWRCVRGTTIRSGTSYPESWTEAFSKALLWEPEATATRREGFPSWSWTGWSGRWCDPYLRSRAIRFVEKPGFMAPEFMVDAPDRGLIPLEDFFTDGRNVRPPSSVLRVRAAVFSLPLEPRVSQSRIGTHGSGSSHAPDTEGELIHLPSVWEYQLSCTRQLWGYKPHEAVETLEAHRLGIFLNFDARRDWDNLCYLPGITDIANIADIADTDGNYQCEVDKGILLIVEQKETVFERIGVCTVPYDVLARVEKQVQTIRLG